MNKEFIPYEQALALKELGFNEPCFGWFRSTLIPSNFTEFFLETEFGMNESPSDWVNSNFLDKACSAPTFSQAFRWFREKYALDSYIRPNVVIDVPKTYQFNIDDNTDDIWYGTYEEAELACLEKLIKIVEQTNAEMTDHGVYK
jgi:hypothetical protein